MGKQNKYGIKVGDVFKSTHGYSMVINDFYKVIEILGDYKIRVRALEKINVNDNGYGQQGEEIMDYDNFDMREKPLDKMVKLHHRYDKTETYYIKISDYEYAYLLPKEDYSKPCWFDYMD